MKVKILLSLLVVSLFPLFCCAQTGIVRAKQVFVQDPADFTDSTSISQGSIASRDLILTTQTGVSPDPDPNIIIGAETPVEKIFEIRDDNGDTRISLGWLSGATQFGSLVVSDDSDPEAATTILSASITSRNIVLRNLAGNDAAVHLEERVGTTDTFQFKGPVSDMSTSYAIGMPPDQPSIGDTLVIDAQDGTTWDAVWGSAGGTSGSSGWIQYSDGSGGHSAESNLAWDATDNELTIIESTTGAQIPLRIIFGGNVGDSATIQLDNTGGSVTKIVAETTSAAPLTTLYFNLRTSDIMKLESDGDVQLTASAGRLLPCAACTTTEIGSSGIPFGAVYTEELDVRNTSHNQTIWTDTGVSYGRMRFNDATATARVNIEGNVGVNMIQMVDSSANQIITIGHSAGGLIQVQGVSGTATSITDGEVNLSNGAETVIIGEHGSSTNALYVNATSLVPSAAATTSLGTSSLYWTTLFATSATLGGTACDITTGSGAPGGGCTTCDVRLRTDGGSGTTLYVCEGGSWAAK